MEFTRRGCCSAAVLAKYSGPYALTPRWMSEVTLLLWTKAHVELSVCARAWHGMRGIVVLMVLWSCQFCSVLNYISTLEPVGTWTHNHVGQSTIGLFYCRRALCSIFLFPHTKYGNVLKDTRENTCSTWMIYDNRCVTVLIYMLPVFVSLLVLSISKKICIFSFLSCSINVFTLSKI